MNSFPHLEAAKAVKIIWKALEKDGEIKIKSQRRTKKEALC